MQKLIDQFILSLTPEYVQGMIIYFIGSIVITIVHIRFAKQWVVGLSGANKLWEGPEILSYLCFWIFPQMIFASGFLKINFPDIAWYTILSFMLFGLTGRWGLEWLLAFKSNATSVTSTIKETKETEVKSEIK